MIGTSEAVAARAIPCCVGRPTALCLPDETLIRHDASNDTLWRSALGRLDLWPSDCTDVIHAHAGLLFPSALVNSF